MLFNFHAYGLSVLIQRYGVDPTICTTLFRVPQCKDYGDFSFHEDDYRIDCSTTYFKLVSAFAICTIILIPFGVPALFMYFMLRAKQRLGGTVNETQLGGAKLVADDVDDESDVYGFLIADCKLLHIDRISRCKSQS
eukprot:COSAG02_NODE_1411_length_12757_cov_226.591642_6_plen_137_part_00